MWRGRSRRMSKKIMGTSNHYVKVLKNMRRADKIFLTSVRNLNWQGLDLRFWKSQIDLRRTKVAVK